MFLNQIRHYYIIYNRNKWKKKKKKQATLALDCSHHIQCSRQDGEQKFPWYLFVTITRFRRWTFHEPNLIHWIKYMKRLVWYLNQLGMPNFHLEQLSHSSRLVQSGILTLDWLNIIGTALIQMANLSCTLVYKSDIKYFVRSLKKLGIFFPLGFSSAAIKISINSALIWIRFGSWKVWRLNKASSKVLCAWQAKHEVSTALNTVQSCQTQL